MFIIRHKKYRKLYEKHLAVDKSEFDVALDEALIYVYETNVQTRICYVSRGETIPDDWVFKEGESFNKSFMVVGIISGRAIVPLLRVQNKYRVLCQLRFKANLLSPSPSFVSERNGQSVSASR